MGEVCDKVVMANARLTEKLASCAQLCIIASLTTPWQSMVASTRILKVGAPTLLYFSTHGDEAEAVRLSLQPLHGSLPGFIRHALSMRPSSTLLRLCQT